MSARRLIDEIIDKQWYFLASRPAPLGRLSIAVKLDDGSVVWMPNAIGHIDMVATLPATILDRVVDGGFVRGRRWSAGGDFHDDYEPAAEDPLAYYGIR